MIDLAKERELFEEWCEYVQGLSTYMIGDEYEHRHTELSWLSWIASASRQGYKLVPVELTNEQAVKISDDPEFFETYQTILNNSDTSEDSVSVLLRVAHKAMIGATE